ncbi:hypothetical protein [Corynebacterium urogenitale]|nr:hypothetical protein [Corynebacterium urogenitale]
MTSPQAVASTDHSGSRNAGMYRQKLDQRRVIGILPEIMIVANAELAASA